MQSYSTPSRQALSNGNTFTSFCRRLRAEPHAVRSDGGVSAPLFPIAQDVHEVYSFSVAGKADLPRARILGRQDHTPDLMTVWLERPVGFEYVAGQYCTIGSGGIERAYSIVSAPHEPRIELYIELVPREQGGNLTPLLWDLRPGDEVTLRPRAKGKFTFEPAHKNHILVATVTGIVPYVSYLRDYFGPRHGQDHRDGSHRFVVLHGASYQDELVYGDELRALAAQHPDHVTYHAAVSRPSEARNAGFVGLHGRANQVIDGLVRQYRFLPAETMIYACGHPAMVADVEARFSAAGYATRIEKYWND